MSKPTPGPWEAQDSLIFATPPDGPKCGVCIASCGDDGVPVQIANAKLISAAPDLLEALRLVREERLVMGSPLYKIVSDAIAKAEK